MNKLTDAQLDAAVAAQDAAAARHDDAACFRLLDAAQRDLYAALESGDAEIIADARWLHRRAARKAGESRAYWKAQDARLAAQRAARI